MNTPIYIYKRETRLVQRTAQAAGRIELKFAVYDVDVRIMNGRYNALEKRYRPQ